MTSDRERWSLRGAVLTCRLERTWHFMRRGTDACEPAAGGDVSTVEFRPGGSLLRHWHKNPDGSAWTSVYEYDGSGRLLRIRTENPAGQPSLEIHEYNEAGRLTRRTVRAVDGRERVAEEFAYPSEGRQVRIVRVDPQGPTINGWGVEGAAGVFSAPGAAAITKIYENEHPVEVLFHDAAGVLLSRVDFRYDETGNLIEEAQTKLDMPFEAETRAHMTPAQLETIRALFGGEGNPLRNRHRYDEQGNRIETLFEMGPLGYVRRIMSYNNHGDPMTQIDEDENRDFGVSDTGQLSETPTKETRTRSEARFRYQYDEHGNWTEKIVEGRSSEKDEFRLSSTERRVLTYYLS